ncbi:unnamed protein product, partial [Thlaspi arvense]
PSLNFTNVYIREGSTTYCISYVYGPPTKQPRQDLWRRMQRRAPLYYVTPRLVLGYFNDIKSNEEKVGGRLRSESSFEAFRSMIVGNGLHDLQTIGETFIWVGSCHALMELWLILYGPICFPRRTLNYLIGWVLITDRYWFTRILRRGNRINFSNTIIDGSMILKLKKLFPQPGRRDVNIFLHTSLAKLLVLTSGIRISYISSLHQVMFNKSTAFIHQSL